MFYYSKLAPHKDKLQGNFKKLYELLDKLFTPILQLLRKLAKPVQVGIGLSIDMSQIILLIILLTLLKFTL